MTNLIRRFFTTCVSIVALSMMMVGTALASTTIFTGFNLFETRPVSNFFFDAPVSPPQFVDFIGNPLGTFDFGSGPVNVGQTDTIVERKDQADLSGGSDTIDIELVALSLVSTNLVDFGFGAGSEDILIDLVTDLGSTMTIFDDGEGQPHGTFDSTLNFRFLVTGSVGGAYATIDKTITATGQKWQHQDQLALILIDQINFRLNGTNTINDFWPTGFVIHDDGSDTAIHTATSVVPIPAALPLFLSGLLGLGVMARRRKKQVTA